MAFVEQGANPPALQRHFVAELNLSNENFMSSSLTLEKHKDTSMQGFFATRALDCLSKSSNAKDAASQRKSSSAIPHWMKSNQVQTTPVDTSLKNGSTRKMVALASMPPETQGALSTALPSPELGFGSEEQTNASIVIDLMDGLVGSRHRSLQQMSARPQLSVCSMPLLSLSRDGQKEEPKISKEDALSVFSHKQEKQPAVLDLPILSLGLSSGQISHERAETSSWVSKFPFQMASSSEQEEHGQIITQHGENLGLNACGEVATIASDLVGSKGRIDRAKFLLAEHSRSSTEAVLPQKTSCTKASMNSAWPLPATTSGPNTPSLKRDWNATVTQSARHSHVLPDFFAQQKVTVVAKANGSSHFVKSEGAAEEVSKVTFPHKSLALTFSEENAGIVSLHGAIHGDKCENPSMDYKSIEQQKRKNGVDTLETRILSSQHWSPRDAPSQEDLLKVKPETSSEEVKNVKGVRFLSLKSVEKNGKFSSSEDRVRAKAVPLGRSLAADRAAKQRLSIMAGIDGSVGTSQPAELRLFRDRASTNLSTAVSARLPSLSLLKHSSDFDGLEEGKCAPRDEDWGGFLTAPSLGQSAEIDEGKLMLPFQQRFEQLQKFLKKCDGSDDEYCLRALCLLSKTAQGNQSAELESRALRLSVEEGKEMKRAKLLNVWEEIP